MIGATWPIDIYFQHDITNDATRLRTYDAGIINMDYGCAHDACMSVAYQ